MRDLREAKIHVHKPYKYVLKFAIFRGKNATYKG